MCDRKMAEKNRFYPSQWEFCFLWVYIGFCQVQFIIKMGVLVTTPTMQRLNTAVAKLNLMGIPKCAACLYGKQHSQPFPGNPSSIIKNNSGNLSTDQVRLGQQVNVDHFNCSTCCRLFSQFGVKDPKLQQLISFV